MDTATFAIARLHARAAAREPVIARLAAETIAAEAAAALPPLPPQAVLLLRRLALALPPRALERLPDARLRVQLSSATRGALAAAAAGAARPALGAVEAQVDAVWFGDEAELLACLACDGLDGRLDRWWWRQWLGRADPDWLGAWAARPALQPAALRLLARAGRAEPVLRALAARAATAPPPRGATQPVERRLAQAEPGRIPDLPPGAVPAACPAPAAAAPASAGQVAPGAAPPGVVDPARAAGRPPSPHAPGAGAGPRADAQAASPWHAAAPAGHPAAGGARPPTRAAASAPADARRSPAVPLAMPSRGAATRSSLARDPHPGAGALRSGAAKARRAATAQPGPPALFARSAAPARHAARLPVDHIVPAAPRLRRHARSAGVAQARRVQPARPGAIRAGLPAGALDAAPHVLLTRHGRLLLLVNVLLGDGLYPDFARPLDPAFPLPLWRMLMLIGHSLVGPAVRADPLWALLARLAADAAPAGPAPVSLRELARRWPAGAPKLARRLRPARPPGRTASPARPAPRAARAGPLARWLARYLVSLRTRLAPALGVAPALVGRACTGGSARLWVSEAELVVVFPLDAHPVEWRLAGLDRDPGPLPGAGRALRFVFE
jgi:hypothetical protein